MHAADDQFLFLCFDVKRRLARTWFGSGSRALAGI
jgi:hypothetical protein